MLQISDQKIGFTSAAKTAFIHAWDSKRKCGSNYVSTKLDATPAAVDVLEQGGLDAELIVCDYNGQTLVMTLEESKAKNSPEVTLYLRNNKWTRNP